MDLMILICWGFERYIAALDALCPGAPEVPDPFENP